MGEKNQHFKEKIQAFGCVVTFAVFVKAWTTYQFPKILALLKFEKGLIFLQLHLHGFTGKCSDISFVQPSMYKNHKLNVYYTYRISCLRARKSKVRLYSS